MQRQFPRLRVSAVAALCISALIAAPLAAAGKPPVNRRDYQVPAGTMLSLRLRTPLGSATNRIDDQVDATLAEAVVQDGVELIPAGSRLHGTVTGVSPASKRHLLGSISIAFAVVQHGDTLSRAAIRTETITLEAQPPAPEAGRKQKKQPVDVVAIPTGPRN